MIRLVRLHKESVSLDSAVVMECSLATESTAEVRNEAFMEMTGLDA